MINLKPEIVKLLKRINNNVAESFPSDWSKFPILVYEEENNTPYTIAIEGECLTLLRYRIEIYSNSSTSEIKGKIDELMTARGFTRIMSLDSNDLQGRRHSVMRYDGVIDLKDNKIYRA